MGKLVESFDILFKYCGHLSPKFLSILFTGVNYILRSRIFGLTV